MAFPEQHFNPLSYYGCSGSGPFVVGSTVLIVDHLPVQISETHTLASYSMSPEIVPL